MFNSYDNDGCLRSVGLIILVLALVFGGLCLEGWLVMLLWNAVLPLIWANAPTLTFWVAVGLVFLVDLLFGGCVKVSRK